jgi:hypothetical protein
MTRTPTGESPGGREVRGREARVPDVTDGTPEFWYAETERGDYEIGLGDEVVATARDRETARLLSAAGVLLAALDGIVAKRADPYGYHAAFAAMDNGKRAAGWAAIDRATLDPEKEK